MRIIAILAMALAVQSAFAKTINHDLLVGVWTSVPMQEGDTIAPTLSNEEVAKSCDEGISVYYQDQQIGFYIRSQKPNQPSIRMDMQSKQACSFGRTSQCQAEMQFYVDGALQMSVVNLDITSAYEYVDDNTVWVRTKSILDGSLAQNNTSVLYRCPIAINAVDQWLQDHHIPINRDSDDTLAQGMSQAMQSMQAGHLDLSEENKQLQQAADNGDMLSARIRGVRYIVSQTMPALGEFNYDKGVHYLTLAADNGDMVARATLAQASLIYNSSNFDLPSFLENHQLAAQAGYADSMNVLAMTQFLGYAEGQPNYAKAGELFTAAANAGSKSAHFNLGFIYLLADANVLKNIGFPVPENTLSQAFFHLVYAAEEGIEETWNTVNLLQENYPQLTAEVHERVLHLQQQVKHSTAPIDPTISINSRFKIKNNQVVFDDADMNLNYVAKQPMKLD